MKKFIIPLSLLIPLPLLAQDEAGLVEQALLALPQELRADATVVRFEDGEQRILKAGKNGLFCHADDPEPPGYRSGVIHAATTSTPDAGTKLPPKGSRATKSTRS